MSCFHPLKGFVIGKTENGKDKYKIVDYQVDHLEKIGDQWKKIYDSDVLSQKAVTDFVKIPCGKCTACRLNYSKKWSERLMAEKETSKSALFLTFTYNNDSLQDCLRIVQNKDYGDISLGYSLQKNDLVLFWKRLRKKFPDCGIRYFACGEYGSETFRPHYHAIVFNLPVEKLDLQYYKTVRGSDYFTSKVLERVWSVRRRGDDGKYIKDENGKSIYFPLGYIVIGEFSQASASYVARYCLKKANTNIDWNNTYVDLNICPEFVTMSRRPGIGLDYFESNQEDFLEFGKKYISSVDGSRQIGLNRYWLSKLEEKYPEETKMLKDNRMLAAQTLFDSEIFESDLEELEYLVVCEDNLNRKIKSLRREL